MSIRRRCSRRAWTVPTQTTKSSYRHPGFESCPGAIRLVGVVPRPVPLTLGDWRLDADTVRAAITSPPRAILLNTRHNPTGCVFSASEITALVEVCVQRDLVCVTNEVYDSFVFGRCEMTSPLDLSAAREHLIAVGSFFKSPQMSVWRLGHCVAPPTLTAGLRRVVERTTVCAATPLQEGDAAVSTASSGAEHFRVTWKPMIERLAGPVWRRSPQRAAGSDSRGSTGPLRCPPTNPPPGRSTRRGPWWHRAPPSSITSS